MTDKNLEGYLRRVRNISNSSDTCSPIDFEREFEWYDDDVPRYSYGSAELLRCSYCRSIWIPDEKGHCASCGAIE